MQFLTSVNKLDRHVRICFHLHQVILTKKRNLVLIIPSLVLIKLKLLKLNYKQKWKQQPGQDSSAIVVNILLKFSFTNLEYLSSPILLYIWFVGFLRPFCVALDLLTTTMKTERFFWYVNKISCNSINGYCF